MIILIFGGLTIATFSNCIEGRKMAADTAIYMTRKGFNVYLKG